MLLGGGVFQRHSFVSLIIDRYLIACSVSRWFATLDTLFVSSLATMLTILLLLTRAP